jgi:hypothetical protein
MRHVTDTSHCKNRTQPSTIEFSQFSNRLKDFYDQLKMLWIRLVGLMEDGFLPNININSVFSFVLKMWLEWVGSIWKIDSPNIHWVFFSDYF